MMDIQSRTKKLKDLHAVAGKELDIHRAESPKDAVGINYKLGIQKGLGRAIDAMEQFTAQVQDQPPK